MKNILNYQCTTKYRLNIRGQIIVSKSLFDNMVFDNVTATVLSAYPCSKRIELYNSWKKWNIRISLEDFIELQEFINSVDFKD